MLIAVVLGMKVEALPLLQNSKSKKYGLEIDMSVLKHFHPCYPTADRSYDMWDFLTWKEQL